ncbi:Sds3-like-domain-containing protein [Calycina marina]|uniref:Sds3-like-domain-containing protein n=1 Tax=Calycina marina TaxID=1763456 RepID=A0A9P7Z095_9HELO|nr:Sds3-like-domain-containing protein [Calycina marina]
MSVDIGRIGGADAILEAAARVSAREELSNVEIDLDGTRSSSLSEIEYKESNHEEEGNFSDNQEDNSEEENDSEAETERLEDSPVKLRAHKDVVMNSHSSLIYDRSPSQLNHQTIPPREPDEEDDDEPLSDEEVSPNDSPKSSVHGDDVVSELPVGPISLEDSAGEGKRTLSVPEIESRKRKRSIMAGNGLDEDIEEPMRKRTGEVSTIGDDYAVEDSEQIEEDQEGDLSNPISGNISDENGGEVQVDIPLPLVPSIQEVNELINAPISPKKRGRKKKKGTDNNAGAQEDDQGKPPTAETQQDGNGGDNNPQNAEDDEAEAALRNEEELGRKRIALDQLSLIEKQFATFRDRLFDERLAQLNREEAMLREDKPTHPEYLAMMQAVDERRDEKIRLANKLREYEWQTLENFAVATRSQVLVQYKQEVREIREKTIEQLGTQWYEIQHDRRSYAGNVPDYTLQFPTRRSQQISHQVAYSNEVSILSGVAKYVGFPSAPTMAKVTDAEFLEDMEKMGVSFVFPSMSTVVGCQIK